MKERIITFSPALDKRNTDPKKNYGIHGVDLRFVLKGDEGAIQFVLYTGWHLPHVAHELKQRGSEMLAPMPADLGYHSPHPMYEGQTSMGPCEYLNGHDCYYDGSSLNAEGVFELLLEEGSDRVWKELEEEYERRFPVNAMLGSGI